TRDMQSGAMKTQTQTLPLQGLLQSRRITTVEGRSKERRFLYEEIGIQSLLDSYSCGSKVLSWRNLLGENKVVQWTLCKKSTLAIITWRRERHSGESFANSTLISLFHFLNCTIGTLYKTSGRIGVELSLDLYLPSIS
ncbi:hypothetical protein Tco_1511348, partial [Tanacetum coccineum]